MEDVKRLADAVEKVKCFFSNLIFSLPPPPPLPPPKKKERKSYVKSCHENCLMAD